MKSFWFSYVTIGLLIATIAKGWCGAHPPVVPPSPSVSPTQPPSSPTPRPSPTPAPHSGWLFGYFYSDGRYSDYYGEQRCYTNLYYAYEHAMGTSSETDSVLISRLHASVARAVGDGKKIYFGVDLSEPLDAIVDSLAPFWDSVAFVEIAGEPAWNAAQTTQHVAAWKALVTRHGLPNKPTGITLTRDAILHGNAYNASGLDWVGVEGYIDAPGGSATQNRSNLLNFFGQANNLIPQDKKLVFVVQAYDRNGGWTNINTLVALQPVALDYAKTLPASRVLGFTLFAYGRPGGTHDHTELRPVHRAMGNEVTGSQCR